MGEKRNFSIKLNNKEVANYEPSFKIDIDWNMNPVTLNIYTDMIKEIIDENKVRRKKEAAERKKKKEREKQMKLEKKESKNTTKVEVKKPTPSITKNEAKPIKVERVTNKPITISKPNNNPIIIVKPKEITISKEADEDQRIDISKE
jgi:hypothetical protein